MKKKFSGIFRAFAGFSPWILFWSLPGTSALIAGLVAAVVLNVWRMGALKTLEVVTLVYFVIHFLFTIILGSSLFTEYGAVLSGITLSGVAWGSLLAGSPFTYQYAKEDWDESYWNDPYFLLVNQIITAVWGVVFTLRTVLALVFVFYDPSDNIRLWIGMILPNSALALGVLFSSKFPNWFVKFGTSRC